MKNFFTLSLVGLVLLLGSASTLAARQATEAKTPTAELQVRAKAFYQDILRNDRMAALELIAPDSKNQFLNAHYDGLVDFRIVGVEIAKSTDRATVKVVRTTRIPSFSLQPLDMEIIDTWQLTDNQWYLVLQPPGELDTPFGKMKFDQEAKVSDPEVLEMKQRVEKAYKNVDPDQYMRALQKVAGNSAEEPKAGEKPPQAGAPDSKTGSQQAKPTTTPAPVPADNPKPQQ